MNSNPDKTSDTGKPEQTTDETPQSKDYAKKHPARSFRKQTTSKRATKRVSDSKPEKNQIAKFAKLQNTPITFSTPILTTFELHTEFTGAVTIAGTLYDILRFRDYRLTQGFTKHEFQYVTLLATYYRCALLTNHSKSAIIHYTGLLKESVKDVFLPDVICDYIETLGHIRLSSDISVIPYFRDYPTMRRKPSFIDAFDYLTAEQQQEVLPHWSINDEVIVRVVQALSRALKGALNLRRVSESMEGHQRMIAGYEHVEFGRIVGRFPEKIDCNEGVLGTCMLFRGIGEYPDGIQVVMVHEIPPVVSETYLTEWIQKSIKSN